MFDAFLRFFNSLKLTLALIVATAFVSGLGTLVPQGEENADQVVKQYGQAAFDRLHALGIDDCYHAWWFLLVLFLFALNLIACTIIRLPKVWRLSQSLAEQKDAPELSILTSTYARDFASTLPPAEALAKASQPLLEAYGSLRKAGNGERAAMIGEKNKIALWGAYIVHLGLLLLLLAGSLRTALGWSKYVVIKEGDKAYLPNEEFKLGLWMDEFELPAWLGGKTLPLPRFIIRAPSHSMTQMRLDHFELQYHENTTLPSLYRSNVTLIEPSGSSRTAAIEVNDPLTFGGVMFYQSSYGFDGLYMAELNVKLPGEKDIYEVRAPYRKRFKLLDSGWELEITDFYPEADMGAPGKIVKTGEQLNNPAIRMRFYQHGVQRAYFWYVFAYPNIQMSKVPGLQVLGKGVDPVAYTVLQAAHDPGIPFALAGALTVLLGLFVSFYLSWHKAWIVAEAEGSGSRLRLVGLCKHNKLSFKRNFEKLFAQVQGVL
jgi:cytochrome c biogenesis protein